MTSQTAGANPAKLTRRLWAILAVVLVADAVDLMDSTIKSAAAEELDDERADPQQCLCRGHQANGSQG